MNALDLWIHSAAAKALGTALAHFVWEGAAIAVLLAGALAVLRGSARVRYGLACAALVAMPIAFGVTLAMLWPRSADPLKMQLPPLDLARVAMPLGSGGAPVPWTFANILPWAAPIWMVGVAAFLVYRFASWIAAQRLRRLGACAAPEEWSRRVGDLAARLKISRHVELLESCLAEVPMLIGYLRPVILVPIGMLTALPVDQIEAILLHELAHIRRADYLVNLLQTAIESVLFYHPAVWWLSSVVRAERENCCDDFVIAGDTDPRTYAAALIALEQGRGGARMALAANDGNLVRRVRRVLRTPASRESNFVMGPVALAIVGAGIAFAAWQPAALKETPGVKSSAPPVANIPSRYKLVIDGPHPIAQVQQTKQPSQTAVQTFEVKYFLWLNAEVIYIITAEEKKAFQGLTTDEEKDKFIEQFWERRDPTPGTPQNEYRDEHYRRIAYANGRFEIVGGRPGWDTDRGRIYTMYGPPNEIESHPTGGSYQRPAAEGGGTTSTYPFEKWRYRWIEGMGNNVIIEFVDTTGNGEYRMTMDPSQKDALIQVPGAPPQAPVQARGSLGLSDGNRRFTRTEFDPKPSAIRIEQLKENVGIMKDQLASLRQKYGEEHPEIKQRLSQITAMEVMLDEYTRSSIQGPATPPLAAPQAPAFRAVHGEAYKESDRSRDGLIAMRQRYGEAHPDVASMTLRLYQALVDEARNPGGFRGKHSGVLIYPEGRVTLVVPTEGPGPFTISGQVETATGVHVSYFEEKLPTAAGFNYTHDVVLKPGSYVFRANLNGASEIVRFEV